MPRGEPEFVRVVRPGVRAAALADDRADVRAGDHVDPRRRRALAGLEGDDVLVSVGCETAQAVAEDALARRERVYRLGAGVAHGLQPVRLALRQHPALDELERGLVGVAEHDAGDGLQQDPLVLGKLFGAPHEDPARLVEHLCFGPRVDQSHDLVLQHRPVAGEILVHDHQVRRQPLHAPVRVGLQHQLEYADAVDVADVQQHDRQIARDPEAPQPRLRPLVAGNDAGRGAAQRIAVNDGGGQAPVDLGIGFAGVEVTQHLLALEPRHFEGAFDEVPVAILVEQREGRLARVRDTRDDLHGDGLVG